MKLDNKGLTLIELIVSIALMSVVMVFMYRLLADVQFDKDNEFFASQNQEQRIEIVDYIEKLVRGTSPTNPVIVTNVSALGSNINITIASTQYQISVTPQTLSVKQTSPAPTKIMRSWDIKQGYFDTNISCNTSVVSSSIDYIPIECSIKVFTDNTSNMAENNNTIDDIILPMLKKK